jgi:hypothetical protein
MVKFKIILFIAVLVAFSEIICSAQSYPVKSDTTKLNQKENVSSVTSKNHDQKDNQNSSQNVKSSTNKNEAVKQVKGARPDMSKANGARPHIIRPNGSVIPKGIGRPLGVGKPGGR